MRFFNFGLSFGLKIKQLTCRKFVTDSSSLHVNQRCTSIGPRLIYLISFKFFVNLVAQGGGDGFIGQELKHLPVEVGTHLGGGWQGPTLFESFQNGELW